MGSGVGWDGRGLDPASTWYAKPCELPKEGLTTPEERMREGKGESWGLGRGGRGNWCWYEKWKVNFVIKNMKKLLI